MSFADRVRVGPALLATAAALAACVPRPTPSSSDTPAPDMARFRSPEYGLVLDYPRDRIARPGFEAGYFMGDRWNPDAPDELPGEALLTLRLPASNAVTQAELRLGASDAPGAASHCDLPPAQVRPPDQRTPERVEIRGVTFRRVATHDAGMSHYRHLRSYRAVHDDQCIAIDLLVAGTDPRVYDPPRSPPFTVDGAFARLTALLHGLRFSR